MRYIVITGLAGSGKTTLAKAIASKYNLDCIHIDDFRYGENWKKKSFDEFKNDLFNHTKKCKTDLVVVEGTYHDPHDENNSRIKVHHQLWNDACMLIILKIDKLKRIGRLIDRSIKRVLNQDSGSCSETTSSRARLMIKNIENDTIMNQELDNGAKYASQNYDMNVKIINDDYSEEIYDIIEKYI